MLVQDKKINAEFYGVQDPFSMRLVHSTDKLTNVMYISHTLIIIIIICTYTKCGGFILLTRDNEVFAFAYTHPHVADRPLKI